MKLAPASGGAQRADRSAAVRVLESRCRGPIEGNAADGFQIGLTHPASMKGILERSDGHLLAVVRETLGTYQVDWSHFAPQGLDPPVDLTAWPSRFRRLASSQRIFSWQNNT